MYDWIVTQYLAHNKTALFTHTAIHSGWRKKIQKHDDNVVICYYYVLVGFAELLDSVDLLSPYRVCYW